MIRTDEIPIKGEVEYVVERAAAGEGCVVSLCPLVFFSTDTGDAWVLDADDSLALPVVRDGTRLAVTITETPERFAIEWGGTFRLEGDAFTFTDNAGGSRTIIGYPTREIADALRRAKS